MENMKTDFRDGIKGSVVIFIQGYLFIFFFCFPLCSLPGCNACTRLEEGA